MMPKERQFRPQIADADVCSGHVKRDGFIDSWRGIFHIIMLLDHLPFVLPSASMILVGFFEFLGYISVAEGFVFLSGFVSGLVYTRIKRKRGNRAMWSKALIRAGEIYICYVVAVVLLIVAVKCGGESCALWGSWLDLINLSLPAAVTKIALLQYQPTFLEILPMYCFFLIGTPIVLEQFERGNLFRISLFSITIWGAAQFGARHVLLGLISPHIDLRLGYFNIFAWQLLFFVGLMCGYRTYVAKTPLRAKGWKLPALAYIVAVILFSFRHNFLNINVDERWISRSSLGPIRLLNISCVIFLVCRFRGYIEKYIAWKGFVFLSKHSLQVFAFHLFPIYLVALIIEGNGSLSIPLQLLVMTFCIASLFLIAFLAKHIKELFSLTMGCKQKCDGEL